MKFTNNYKLLPLLFIGLLFFISCSNSLLKTKQDNFTRAQRQLINSKGEESAMRVFIINNKADSILLRSTSTPIDISKNQNQVSHFANRLEKTMMAEMGVGIAAPQVGILKQMICVQRFDKEGFPNEIFVNPVITKYSAEKQDCREGCLSIPGRSDTTQIRSLTIELTYQTIEGKQKEESVSGFTAVIFQHEIDHLNGILYIDHLLEETKM